MTPDIVVCIGLLLIIVLIILSFYIQYDYCDKIPTTVIKTVEVEKPSDVLYGGEVYHLSNNIYTYDDAQKACAKYGGKLATKEQIDNAYKNGANWCSYGWSADSQAYFPIQKTYYDKLSNNNKGSCGKVGVNGGIFKNQSLKFGANCYGPRPSKETMKDDDTLSPFNDTWLPNGNTRVETFVCNGNRIAILDGDINSDNLYKLN
jgi:hypothetical protein